MVILLICADTSPRVPLLQTQMVDHGCDVKTVGPDVAVAGVDGNQDAVVILEEGEVNAQELCRTLRTKPSFDASPIFVVAGVTVPEDRKKYLAAGATHVWPLDESDDFLAVEFRTSLDVAAGGFSHESTELLQPFVAATIEAMETMAGIETSLASLGRKHDYRMPGDISGLIDLFGGTERLMAVSFPMETARGMAAKVLGEIVDEPGLEMIFDCVGELASIVAGQVKGRFVHTDFEFDISIPSIVFGKSHEIHYRSELPSYTMEFESDVGAFVLQLCIRDRDPGFRK